jgi:hypothetical protein
LKYLLIIFLLPFTSKGQYIPDPTDYVQPYLLSDGRVIVGANTSLLNADSLETGIDTIFYKLEVSFPNQVSPVHVRIPSDSMLVYEMVLAMNAYAIWQRDPIVGNHWHIYDELRRPIEFLIRRGAVIWKIIETGQK